LSGWNPVQPLIPSTTFWAWAASGAAQASTDATTIASDFLMDRLPSSVEQPFYVRLARSRNEQRSTG
jgi:hypothetical protein